MESNNKRIIDFCKTFITSKDCPQFAILLKGTWGVGKTYLINSLCDEFKSEKNYRLLRISLFGVKRTEEIDIKIYEAFHPTLASNGAKMIGAILKSAIQLGTKEKIGEDSNLDLNLVLPELKYSSNKENKRNQKNIVTTIIVDDIERALISISEIFGYFSDFITDSYIRIIFVGDETKIEDQEKYKEIKEKTIGQEFSVHPDFDDAIKAFFDELCFPAPEKLLVCKELYNVLLIEKCDNLRIIRQTLYCLKFFLQSIDFFSEENKSECISTFILLSILKNLHSIEIQDIHFSLIAYYSRKTSWKQYLAEKEKYKQDPFFDLIYNSGFKSLLSEITWADIIFKGIINKDTISKEYNEKIKENEAKDLKKLFVFMSSWQDLSKEEFKKFIEDIEDEFENCVYLHPGEVLHYALLMLFLSDERLIPESNQEILEQIQRFLSKQKMETISDDDWAAMIAMGYSGYLFSDDSVSENKNKIRSIIKDYCSRNFIGKLKDEIQEKVQELGVKVTIENFCKGFFHNPRFESIPILSLMDINVFFSKIITSQVRDIFLIVEFLEDRYGKKYNSTLRKEYYEDYSNLKELDALFKNHANKDILFNPKIRWLNKLSLRMNDLVEFFAQQMSK